MGRVKTFKMDFGVRNLWDRLADGYGNGTSDYQDTSLP